MPFVSVTRLRLRNFLYLVPFMFHAMRSSNQIIKSPGFLKGKTLLDKHLTFWTISLWKEQNDMRAYRIADAHKEAMPKLQQWCDEASVVHWMQESDDIPDWQTSYLRMKSEGRVSKVKHPSPGHTNMDVPPPRYPSQTERILLPKKQNG